MLVSVQAVCHGYCLGRKRHSCSEGSGLSAVLVFSCSLLCFAPLPSAYAFVFPVPPAFLSSLQWKDEKDTIKDFVKKRKVLKSTVMRGRAMKGYYGALLVVDDECVLVVDDEWVWQLL